MCVCVFVSAHDTLCARRSVKGRGCGGGGGGGSQVINASERQLRSGLTHLEISFREERQERENGGEAGGGGGGGGDASSSPAR